MPNAISGGWGGTSNTVSTQAAPPGYEDIVIRNGARYDQSLGQMVREVPDGRFPPTKGRDGKWRQRTQIRYVARSLQEARTNGELWDYFMVGIRCRQEGCDEPLIGWVRGGRKFEIEHGHILKDRYEVSSEMVVDPPDDEIEPEIVEVGPVSRKSGKE